MMVWILEGALVLAALFFRKTAVLRYVAVLGVVLLLHTPLLALYNVAALAGVALLLAERGAAARMRRAIREPLVLLLAGLLGALAVSTVLARGAIPEAVWMSSMRGLAGIAATGSLALFAFLDEGEEARRGWGLAIAVSALVICGIRLVAETGLDLYPALRAVLHAEPPGQLVDFGSRNAFGEILNAALPVILLVGRANESRAAGFVRYVAAALSIVTMAFLSSRTGMVVMTLSLSLLSLLVFLLLKNRGALLRPVLFATLASVLVFALSGRLSSRPVYVENMFAPPASSVGILQDPAGAPASVGASQLKGLLFRIPLTNNYHSFVQSFLVSTPEPYQIDARATPTCRGRLRILVDGVPHLIIRGRESFPVNFKWTSLSLPALEVGKWHTLAFVAEGDLTAVDSYYEIAAIRYVSDVVRSEFFVHGRPVEGDLSADPGRQEGIALILPGEESHTLPPGRWLAPQAASLALDQSLRDRVELWKIAWEHARQRPVLGWGFYTFGHYFALLSPGRGFFDDYPNTDSLYFELLHDGGFLALLLLAGVAVAAASAVHRRCAGGPTSETVALAVAVGGSLVNSLTQTTLADQRYYALVAILIGLLLGEGRPVQPHAATRS
ncbi:MAG: O-antigen ligase family protein [Thermoanaerobaculia bacterium]